MHVAAQAGEAGVVWAASTQRAALIRASRVPCLAVLNCTAHLPHKQAANPIHRYNPLFIEVVKGLGRWVVG